MKFVKPSSKRLAVIWDMDGVIVDTGMYHFSAWKRLLREHGIDLTEAGFKRTFGMRNEEIIRIFFGEDASRSQIDELAERKEEYFRQSIRDRIVANPGAVNLVRDLFEAGFLQAVASSAPRQNVELILTALDITNYFASVISAEDVEIGKPAPDIFLTAAKRLSVDPRQCVVIEDAIAGVQAAKAAGMKCIAVTTTNPTERLAAADLIIDSLEQLKVSDIEGIIAG